MGVDEKYLELMEKGVTKELNRLHDWLETEAKRITQIDKDFAVNLEKLKADLKAHVDEKIEALETKLTTAIKEAVSEGGAGLGYKEKAAIGGGVGLGALALIKHIFDMIWGSGAAG
jgi:thermostable 8-oxoguanine DNA glycosylase